MWIPHPLKAKTLGGLEIDLNQDTLGGLKIRLQGPVFVTGDAINEQSKTSEPRDRQDALDLSNAP